MSAFDALPIYKTSQQGFTLIELSIVLVIIGLIVGGVLVGQDLIRAAEVRATVSQIEKYNTAVNTFRGKYNAMPGDLNAATATQFGFTARSATGAAGAGDGNGVLECLGTANSGFQEGGGETGLFWQDLSTANGLNVNLVDGSFSIPTLAVQAATGTAIANFLPQAKLGRGNYVYVYSTGGVNYYGISAVTAITATTGAVTSGVSMTTQQAYQIDKKVDDGIPITGRVQATYDTGTLAQNVTAPSAVHAAAANGAATDCYDSTTSPNYDVGYNDGSSPTCALSLRFQ